MTNKARNSYLLKKYGITLREYNLKLKEQKHSCWICKKHKSKFKRSLAVDHNHKTGQVRGLLCFRCNKFMVGRHDKMSASILFEYMSKFEQKSGTITGTVVYSSLQNAYGLYPEKYYTTLVEVEE